VASPRRRRDHITVDDRWLYVSCFGTGELKQYDISDPENPREAGSVHLGRIVRRTPHPAAPDLRLRGGPQMVEVSRDGRRVYVTNSLYAAWDEIFYPEGVGAWLARLDAGPPSAQARDHERRAGDERSARDVPGQVRVLAPGQEGRRLGTGIR